MPAQFLRFFYYLVIAFVIGTLAQLITGYRKRNLVTTLVLGFVGVVVGDWLAYTLRFPHIVPPFFGISIVWSILGAVVFILLYGLLRGRL